MPSKTPYFGFSKVMLADLGDADQIKAIFTIPTNPIPPPIADILAVHAYSESPLDAIRSSTLVDQLCEAYKATWSPQTRAWLARHHPDTSAPDRSMALVKTAVTLMENLPPILGTYGGSKITSHGSVSRWLQDISDIRPSLVLPSLLDQVRARAPQLLGGATTGPVASASSAFEAEVYLLRLGERAAELKKALATGPNVPHFRLRYNLKARRTLVYNDRASLLRELKADAVERIMGSDRGDTDQFHRGNVERQLDRWEKDYCTDEYKSYEQLKLLAMSGDVHLTPEFLMETGFSTGELLGDETAESVYEQSACYLKFQLLDVNDADVLKASLNGTTVACGNRIANFCAAPSPSYVPRRFRRAEKYGNKVYAHHTGRFKNGVGNRRQGERGFGPLKPAESAWRTIVQVGGGASKLRYYRLADYTKLTHAAWAEKYMWDELIFSVMFWNSCHSNSAWPGGDAPYPPLVPGETIGRAAVVAEALQADLEKVVRGYVLSVLKSNPQLDVCTALCLRQLGFDRRERDAHAFVTAHRYHQGHTISRDWRSNKRGRANKVVITGLDQDVEIPVRKHSESTGIISLELHMFVLGQVTETAITLRPAGVDLHRWGPTRDPLDATVRAEVRTDQDGVWKKAARAARSKESPVNSITVRFGLLEPRDRIGQPYDPCNPPLGIYMVDCGTKHWLGTKRSGILSFQFQQEAMALLLGLPVERQTQRDLAFFTVIQQQSSAAVPASVNPSQSVPPSQSAPSLLPSPPKSIQAQWKKLVDAEAEANRERQGISPSPLNRPLGFADYRKPDLLKAWMDSIQVQRDFLLGIRDTYDVSKLDGAAKFTV